MVLPLKKVSAGCATARGGAADRSVTRATNANALRERIPGIGRLRGRTIERPVAANGGAMHAADVGQAVPAAGAVIEAAVVPDDEVAVAPSVPVVEARLQHE